jgi:diguanylate cyclase (GGDEF)-like protein
VIPTSLRARVLALLVGLLLVTQLATSAAVLHATGRDAQAAAAAALAAGGRVFDRLLVERERQLLSSVGILASDFGFKLAVASADLPTIESVLENHGGRIGADAALLIALSGDVAAVFPRGVRDALDAGALSPLLRDAERDAGTTGILMIGGAPHQVVVVPVNAPLRIGWVCMGFRLDDALARELRGLTGLEVSFWSRRDPAQAAPPASTLPAVERDRLHAALARDLLARFEGAPAVLPGTDWLTLAIPLARGGGARAGAILQTSLDAALAPYRALRAELIVLFAAGLGLALAGALVTARGIARPLHQLAGVARRIAAGDYGAPIDAGGGDEIGVLAESFRSMQRAIAEREAEIVHRASHDALTELPNRAAAGARLAELVARRGPGDPLEIALVDISRLKDINSALGHAAGDAVLRAVAERLRARCGAAGLVARIGGDEFLAALDRGRDAPACEVGDLLREVEAPIRAGGALVRLRAAAGSARFPEDGADPETLVRRAELALSRGKSEGAPLERYAGGLEEANARRIEILAGLEAAIAADALELHYQPKVSVAARAVVGAEALVRFTHPRLGPLRPDEFVALAEQAGAVRPLTQWVLRRAIRTRRELSARGLDLRIAVNLSARDLGDASLPATIAELLGAERVSPADLGVEVTESSVMADPAKGSRILHALREVGVAVAIDDFGTGHSSLAQLKQLPADELKIDKSFVKSLREGSADFVIVRAAIELGHKLGLKVVAEGVEDAIAWRLLARLRCDAVQGYHVSRPLPAAALPAWIDAWSKRAAEDGDGDVADGDPAGRVA